MEFKARIAALENEVFDDVYILNVGKVPVLLTAVHTMMQVRENKEIKLSEPYTKAIARYVAEESGAFSFIKLKDTGVDSNRNNDDVFKRRLLDLIEKYQIKLVLDLHGAMREREFDVELGSLNNLSSDYSTIKELEDAFRENGITNIVYNEPFKGGGITQSVFENTNIDVIQIEINRRFRDIDNPDEMESVCLALISFVLQYNDYLCQ